MKSQTCCDCHMANIMVGWPGHSSSRVGGYKQTVYYGIQGVCDTACPCLAEYAYVCLCLYSYGCMCEMMGCIFPWLTWNIIQHDRRRVFLNICLHILNKHGIVQIWPETDAATSCGLLKEMNHGNVVVHGILHSELMSPAWVVFVGSLYQIGSFLLSSLILDGLIWI